jgi:hypothetical protein
VKAGVESSRMTLGICFGGADFFITKDRVGSCRSGCPRLSARMNVTIEDPIFTTCLASIFLLVLTYCTFTKSTTTKSEDVNVDPVSNNRITSTDESEAEADLSDVTQTIQETTASQSVSDENNGTNWKCVCEEGGLFLPPSLMRSLSGPAAVFKMGAGGCYHKQM